MGDLIVKKQYFICQNADQIADEFLVMVAGGGAGGTTNTVIHYHANIRYTHLDFSSKVSSANAIVNIFPEETNVCK